MRIGIVVDLTDVGVEEVPGLARHVDAATLDLFFLRSSTGRPAEALTAAASCASVAPALQMGALVHVTASNPVYVAEERNVVDQLLGGRLVLALEAGLGAGDRLAEWTEVLLLAAGTVPFRHEGSHHRIPAGLPANSVNPEHKLVITPQPFGLDPQLWVSGPDAARVAEDLGLSLLEQPDDQAQWADLAAALGRRALRLRRPAFRTWDPAREDARDLAVRLVRERDDAGLDTVLVGIAAQAGGEEWRGALAELASVVRPRVQMYRLPEGLESFWDQERHAGPHRRTSDDPHDPSPTTIPIDREAMT